MQNRFKGLPKTPALSRELAASFAPVAQAACLSDLEAAALVANDMAKMPVAKPEGLSKENGECSRSKVNRFLAQQIGATHVGYKAGLTNPVGKVNFR